MSDSSAGATAETEQKKTKFVDYYELWGLSQGHDRLIRRSRNYAVWIDEHGDLAWQTDDELDREIEEKVDAADLKAVYDQAAMLRACSVQHLTDVQRNTVRVMVGEGLGRLFEFDAKGALQMLDKAAGYALARNQEVARMWYLCATGFAAAFFALLLGVGWLYRGSIPNLIGENAFYLSLGSCAGALGAFFSILTRVGTTPLDPSAGWRLHFLEGFGRILVGSLGALFAQIAIKLGLLLTMLDKGHAGLFFVAFIAGASERLVPSLIKKVEIDASSEGQGKDEKDQEHQ